MNDVYFFSWEDGFSTHPDWEKFPYGRIVRITCNGMEMRHVFYCLTGKNGFVKRATYDSEGCIVCVDGKTVTEYHRGEVEVAWEKE